MFADVEICCTANDAQVAAAKALVKAFSKAGEFKPESFPNPALAHHYEVLISTALGKPLPGDQDVVDYTIPDYAQIKKVSLLDDTSV